MKVFRLSDIVDPSPRAMTARARTYLSIASYRHIVIGAFILAAPWLFSAAAFIPIFGLVPLMLWGFIMTAEGVLCATAAITRNGSIARIAVGVSAVITMALALGLWVGVVASWVGWGHAVGWDNALALIQSRPETYPVTLLALAMAPPSPFLPIVLTSLTLKDFVMVAQPLRVPLEESTPRPRLA